MTMKLYHYTYSGHSHRVRLMLSLMGIQCEAITVDLRKGENKTAAYLALNPLGEVPTLVDGRLVVTAKIREYLANNPGEFDPRKYLGAARKELIELLKHKNEAVLGSAGKA